MVTSQVCSFKMYINFVRNLNTDEENTRESFFMCPFDEFTDFFISNILKSCLNVRTQKMIFNYMQSKYLIVIGLLSFISFSFLKIPMIFNSLQYSVRVEWCDEVIREA